MLNGYKGDDLVPESRRERGLYHFVSSVSGAGLFLRVRVLGACFFHFFQDELRLLFKTFLGAEGESAGTIVGAQDFILIGYPSGVAI